MITKQVNRWSKKYNFSVERVILKGHVIFSLQVNKENSDR